MRNRSARAPSQRQLRVGELVRHAIVEMLQRGEISDPDIGRSVITVSEARMTPDLKTATVFVMPLGGGAVDRTVAALDRSRKRIRYEVARRLDLRYAPDLKFRADPSFAEGEHIDTLLRSPKVRRDLTPEADGSSSDDRH